MKITVIEPQTPEEFNKYYNLRFEILRKPWGQTKGSERDNDDEISHHRMIFDEITGDTIAVGRLQFNTKEEAQIRYMAVADNYQGQRLGSKIVTALEDIALDKGASRIILQARSNAVQFYQSNGYEIVKKTHLLFDEIQHWLMKKELTTN